jgi:hypothetical protein
MSFSGNIISILWNVAKLVTLYCKSDCVEKSWEWKFKNYVQRMCRASELGWKPGSVSEFFRTVPAEGKRAAAFVKPLFIGKVSTAMQFALVGTCAVNGAFQLGLESYVLDQLAWHTAFWTAISGTGYVILSPLLGSSAKAFVLLTLAGGYLGYHVM